jgi:hypothetical protein
VSCTAVEIVVVVDYIAVHFDIAFGTVSYYDQN